MEVHKQKYNKLCQIQRLLFPWNGKEKEMPNEETARNISETRCQQASNTGEANHFNNNPQQTG
jgi:hypothetical protein